MDRCSFKMFKKFVIRERMCWNPLGKKERMYRSPLGKKEATKEILDQLTINRSFSGSPPSPTLPRLRLTSPSQPPLSPSWVFSPASLSQTQPSRQQPPPLAPPLPSSPRSTTLQSVCVSPCLYRYGIQEF